MCAFSFLSGQCLTDSYAHICTHAPTQLCICVYVHCLSVFIYIYIYIYVYVYIYERE